MTHPDDRVYNFTTLDQWARGASDGLGFATHENGLLHTPSQLIAQSVARVAHGETIVALARDLIGRPLWLTNKGALWVLAEPGPVQLADLPDAFGRSARRLIWGQDIGWLVTGHDIIRLDVRTGNRMGAFSQSGWQVQDAVPDRCDGTIVVETQTRGGDIVTRLREIRPEGLSRVLIELGAVGDVVASARFDAQSPVIVVVREQSWAAIEVVANEVSATHRFPNDTSRHPTQNVTMSGSRRMVMATPHGDVFSAAFGLLEPTQTIDGLPRDSSIADLLWSQGVLYVATGKSVYAVQTSDVDNPQRSGIYVGPVLHSPPADRSGWLRADVFADVPTGARVILRHRGFSSELEAQVYTTALSDDPHGVLVREGWQDEAASTHFGTTETGPMRHYLGEVDAEYLAMRIDVSVPACAPALFLRQMSIYYPNRSLIEELPAIYRTGDGSERQMRRMLAPFQALADEIDDLIGDSVRRVDPATADDLWTGFLLRWLGHDGFVRLDPKRRRGLLRALPEILGLRGTMAGLARVLDELAPQGYSIEDTGLTPDAWVLPSLMDPAGARLGSETRVAHHVPQPLTLGGCLPLGEAVLKHACFDPASVAQRCHGEVTVHIFGGDAAEEALAPFTDRIVRAFVPAHTRVAFRFGAIVPPHGLERGRSLGPDTDPMSLITLDTGDSRNLGAWRLPRGGSVTVDTPATLNSAVLDGTLILQ